MKELIIKKGDKQITVADKEDVMDALGNKSDKTHNHDNSYLQKIEGVSQNSTNGDITLPVNYQSISGATGNIPVSSNFDKSSQSLTDALPTLKTIIGTIKSSNNKWWNIISARHRNGSNDGNMHGLYLKSLLTGDGDLIWNKQYKNGSEDTVGTWIGERTILDSNNYNNYTAPTNHTHTKSQITDFPTSMTPTAHTHTKTDITTVTIPKNADLNDDAYWQVGIYTVGSTNGGTISNRPDYLTGNYAFELEVHGFGSTLLQILKTLTSNNNYERLFYRAKTGVGFSKWFRIANYDEIPLGHVITSGNIDTLTDDGVYGISKTNISAGNITGVFPPTNRTGGVRSFLLESRKYDSNSSIQFAYMLTTTEDYNRIFYRSRTGGEWDTWREIVQKSDIDAINTALDNKIDTAGTNLSKSGTTLKHATSGSGSLTTATLKKVKFDAQGHITGTANPNSVACTVTYVDGTTSTINLVTR